MSRLTRKLFDINDELLALAEEERLVGEELVHHRHLHDDAVRDAAVSGLRVDREEAGLVAADVRRFERRLAEIAARRARLESDRAALLERLG
jgi:hypothetical protein